MGALAVLRTSPVFLDLVLSRFGKSWSGARGPGGFGRRRPPTRPPRATPTRARAPGPCSAPHPAAQGAPEPAPPSGRRAAVAAGSCLAPGLASLREFSPASGEEDAGPEGAPGRGCRATGVLAAPRPLGSPSTHPKAQRWREGDAAQSLSVCPSGPRRLRPGLLQLSEVSELVPLQKTLLEKSLGSCNPERPVCFQAPKASRRGGMERRLQMEHLGTVGKNKNP